MTPVEFCYWLQGYFELADVEEEVPTERTLTPQQVNKIMNHLALVFKHGIDPSYTDHLPEDEADKMQKELQKIHDTVKQSTLNPIRPKVYRC